MLTRMAPASAVATPTAAELKQFDREPKGKRLSNAERRARAIPRPESPACRTCAHGIAYKPEHAVDLDTEAIVAAEVQPADRGDTTTLETTLEAAARGLNAAGCAPTIEVPGRVDRRPGLITAAPSSRTTPAAPGRPGSPSPSPRRSSAGVAISTPGGPSMAIGRGGVPGLAKPRSRCGPRGWSAALRSPSTRGGLRRAWLRGRENVQKRSTSSMPPATTSVS